MAKSRRRSYESLPLGEPFYAWLARTAARLGLRDPGEAALGRCVSELSEVYTRARDGLETRAPSQSARVARLHFFLPRDLVKVMGPLDELARQGRMPARAPLRVLDVGAGLGTTTFGLSRWLRMHSGASARLEVLALERDPDALAVFRELSRRSVELPEELAPIALDARADDVTRGVPRGPFDVVLLGFVLNELFPELPEAERVAAHAELLTSVTASLAPGGVIVVLEPALKAVTRSLMRVRDALVQRDAAPHVLAPCVRRGPCPMLASERDWCHEELPYALPPRLAHVARAAGLRFEGLSYAALVLGDTPRRAPALERDAQLVRLVSDRLESKGKLELFGCGEAGYVKLTRLDRDASEANEAWDEAARGQVVAIEGAALGRLGPETLVKRL